MSVDVGTARGFLDLDISGFLSGLRSAQSEAQKAQQDLSNTLGDGLTAIGGKLTSAGKTLTAAVTTPVIGMGAAAVKTSATFESGMSQIQATMGITKDSMTTLNGESVNTMNALSALAQQMGSTTKFSATEAADAINILAMAGYDTEKIYGSLPNILNLAAAGNLGIADAADIATGVMSGFNMSAEDSAMVADKIAMMASSAKGSVSEFGQAMATAAGQASVTGQSFDDTAVALEILGNHNLSAAEGGNALNRVLKNIYQPTEAAAAAMKDLGVSAYDAEGNARRLPDVLQDFQDKLGGLTDEEYNDILGQIFDSATLKSVPFLINDCTAAWDEQDDSVTSLIEGIRGASDAYDGIGAASGQAQAQMDNLSGQITLLKSALEGVAIQIGNILMPYIKQFVEKIQSLVDWFGQLSTEQQEQVVKYAMIAAAIGPVLLGVGKLITGAGNLIKGFKEIKSAVSLVSQGFSLLGGAATGPILAIVAAIAVLVAAFMNLWKNNEEFREKMIAIWERLKEAFSGFVEGIKERMDGIKQAFQNIVNFVKPIWDGFCQLLAPIFEGAFSNIVDILSGVLDMILGLVDIFIGVFTGDWDKAWTGVKEVFGAIWETICNIFQTAADTIGAVVDVILGWFGTSWEEIIGGIAQWFKDTWQGIVDFWVGIGEAIGAGIDAICDFFSNLPGRILEFITNAINHIIEWKENMVTKARETGQNFLQRIVDFFTDLPNKIAYFIGYALTSVIVWAVNMVNKARQMASDFLTNVVNFFTQLPGKILQFITSAWQNVVTWATNMVNKAREMAQNFLDHIVSFFTQLPGKILNFITSAWNNVVSWATNMVNKAREMAQNFLNNIVSFFTQLPGKVLSFLNSTISNVLTFVSNMKTKATEAAQGFFNNIVSGLASLPDKMKEIGSNIVNGIWNGISAGWDWLKGKVSDLANSLLQGAKDALGIKSPSKRFENEFGIQLPAGAAVGVEKAMPSAITRIQSAFSNGMSKIKTPTLSLFDTVKSGYENVVEWFESLDTRLRKTVDSMAEQLAFLMDAGQIVANADGTLSYVNTGFFGNGNSSLDVYDPRDKGPTPQGGTTINFYSNEKIDEIEASRLLKKTQRDISEGF